MVEGARQGRGVVAPGLVEVRALGGFAVTVDGRFLSRADWQRVSAERLFKLLLGIPDHRATREVAAETLWPESSAEAGRTNLRKAIHFAHRALGGHPVLVADATVLRLDPAYLRLDLDRLADAFAALSTTRPTPGGGPRDGGPGIGDAAPEGPGDQPADRPALDAALDTILELGALDLLPEDVYEDWLVGPRERLRSGWQRLALVAARRAREEGRFDRAHELVDRILDRDPADEAAHRLAIELYAAEGRHHAARRQLELCRVALRALDAEPSDETLAVYRAAGLAAHRDERPGGAVFIGRRHELELIGGLLDLVVEGRPAGLVIRGAAGIGKSRLLEEIEAYARSSGWRVVTATAIESLRVEPFAPLRLALSNELRPADVASWSEPAASGIGTLIPGYGTPRLAFQDRQSLLVALVAVVGELADRGPVLLAVDDLPWLDASSVAFLEALLGGCAGRPVLVAGTLRDDEPVPAPVDALVARLPVPDGLVVELGPLRRRDVDQLVLGHLGGTGLDDDLGQLLFDQCGGNPLFCLELVRAAAEHGDVREQDGRWRLVGRGGLPPLPDSARRIAARRLGNLPAPARDLLEAAAELGAEASFDLLGAAAGRVGRSLVEALDAALASGLLVETATGYRFAHPLYRMAVASAGGAARRAATRLAIAQALAGVPDASDADNVQELDRLARASADALAVAEHALAAVQLGRRDAGAMAAAFGFAAGDRLMRLHDRATAAAVLRAAVEQWRRLPADEGRLLPAANAYAHLGRLHADNEDLTEASRFFREALAACRTPEEAVEVYDSYWQWVPYRRGDFERARALVEEGLARLPPDAVVARSHLSGMLGWTLVRLRRIEEALPILEQAAANVDPTSDAAGALRVLDPLGMTLHYLGRTEEGRPYVERALAIALGAGHTSGEIIGNLHVAILLARSGEVARARPLYERAAELGRLTGDAYSESLASWGTAEAADELGDEGAARAAREREIELLDCMGGNPHNAAMAHAHLANLAARRGDVEAAGREALEARRLARLSTDAGYPARIERAISIEHWADLAT